MYITLIYIYVHIYIHTELDDTSVKNTVLYMQVTVFYFSGDQVLDLLPLHIPLISNSNKIILTTCCQTNTS